jgi:hypothetical protein
VVEKANKRGFEVDAESSRSLLGSKCQHAHVKTYRTYARPLLKYGTEVFATTTENHIEILN